mmetsp:Transcript_10205/g.33806  ORF Transcript_10205/g.33806 Transcript_10205/m.33806 type:complete len:125 (+) Transcript_10205:3-377(+)
MMGDWTGSRDARGRPHGRGTLRLSKRARFEGRMVRGERSGLGTLFVDEASSDEEDGAAEGCESSLRVRWRDDEPCGRGVFSEPGGGTVHGTWSGGLLQGSVTERHADGTVCRAAAVPGSAVKHD